MIRTPRALRSALLTVLAAVPVAAQSFAGSGEVPVTVALTDSGAYGQQVVILRRPDAEAQNVIVLARGAATPERLAAATAALRAIVVREGARPVRDELVRVPSEASGPRGDVTRAQRVLDRLSRAAPDAGPIPGVGAGRSTHFYIRGPHEAGDGPAPFRSRTRISGGGGSGGSPR